MAKRFIQQNLSFVKDLAGFVFDKGKETLYSRLSYDNIVREELHIKDEILCCSCGFVLKF